VNPLALTVTLGDTASASNSVLITMPSVEIMFAPLDVPEAEEVTIVLPFKARSSALALDDEIQLDIGPIP